jgi:DNA mismatch repair protein MutL
MTHNGKLTRRWPAVEDSADRAADVLGRRLQTELFPLALANDAAQVSGWVASPRVNRSTSRGIHLFVNRRHVKARTLLHAVMQGFRQRLMKGQFPVAVCFVTVPPDQVDVNVHPTKHEVRFARQREVHGIVAGAVAAALDRADRERQPGAGGRAAPTPPDPPRIGEPREAFQIRPGKLPRTIPPVEPSAADRRAEGPAVQEGPRRQGSVWQEGRFGGMRIIGQFKRTYILCESAEGLVLVDQHAAHERIFYEQLHRRRAAANAGAQKLLIPETFELNHREAALLDELGETLTNLGFEIEPFGGTTYAVKAAPAMLVNGAIEPVIREILEKRLEAGGPQTPADALDASVKIMACHGAIRARQQLDERQVRRLLQQMDECDNPSHCPHGRPTWIRWTARELEKAFGREP